MPKSKSLEVYSEHHYSPWYVYWDGSLYHPKEMQPCFIWYVRSTEPAVVNYERVAKMKKSVELFSERSVVSDEEFDELTYILTRFKIDMDRRYQNSLTK